MVLTLVTATLTALVTALVNGYVSPQVEWRGRQRAEQQQAAGESPLRVTIGHPPLFPVEPTWVLPALTPAIAMRVQQLTRDQLMQNPEPIVRLGGIRLYSAAPPKNIASGDYHRWSHAGATGVSVLLEGRHPSGVVIREIHAKVTKRGPPLAAAKLVGPATGDAQDLIQVALNLDEPRPVMRNVDGSNVPREPYFAGKYLTLARGEAVMFLIQANTNTCYCEWELVIDAVVDGTPRAIVVRDGSQPFRATAFASRYQAVYQSMGTAHYRRVHVGASGRG